MQHARWNVDYIHKKNTGQNLPQKKSISQLVLEEKRQQKYTATDATSEQVRRILEADQSNLDQLE